MLNTVRSILNTSDDPDLTDLSEDESESQSDEKNTETISLWNYLKKRAELGKRSTWLINNVHELDGNIKELTEIQKEYEKSEDSVYLYYEVPPLLPSSTILNPHPMDLKDRISISDPCYHPVLSSEKDIKSLYWQNILKFKNIREQSVASSQGNSADFPRRSMRVLLSKESDEQYEDTSDACYAKRHALLEKVEKRGYLAFKKLTNEQFRRG